MMDIPLPVEKLIALLADIREMFPVPERGSKLEQDWAGAMGMPECIPVYVEACLAASSTEYENVLRASRYTADLATQALETVSDLEKQNATLLALLFGTLSQAFDDELPEDTQEIAAGILKHNLISEGSITAENTIFEPLRKCLAKMNTADKSSEIKE